MVIPTSTLAVTSNGTKNVFNYAQADVKVTGQWWIG
jgi:hypothetical protein